MNLEMLKVSASILPLFHEVRQEKILRGSRLLFYADTEKQSRELQISPKKFKGINLEKVEIAMDLFLHEHWSLHDNPNERWPRLYTSIDPSMDRVYRLEEFPIKVDGLRVLSIKQSVRENEKLIALCYRLATLDNS